MTEFVIGAYRLEMDAEATRAYYATHKEPWITCGCAGCRNFARAVESLPEAVRTFFRQLGLAPEKVQELCYYTCTERTVAGDCWYHLVGSVLEGASQPGEYPQNIAEGFSVGFKNACDLLPEDFPRPCCQMNFGFVLPWVLEEKNPYIYQ